MPTDRHTATGTCEFGRAANNIIRPALQENSTRWLKKIYEAIRRDRLRGDFDRDVVRDLAPARTV
jgi:hypothetical protein